MNIVALNAALDWIEANPDQHNQGEWRCGTGMCLAGVVCHLDPDTAWYSHADDYTDVLCMDHERAAAEVVRVAEATPTGVGALLLTIPFRASQILGINGGYEGLFAPDNTLTDLREMATELAGHHAKVPA